jgi:hypothetical protein
MKNNFDWDDYKLQKEAFEASIDAAEYRRMVSKVSDTWRHYMIKSHSQPITEGLVRDLLNQIQNDITPEN